MAQMLTMQVSSQMDNCMETMPSQMDNHATALAIA
jgi:hypothetical protein